MNSIEAFLLNSHTQTGRRYYNSQAILVVYSYSLPSCERTFEQISEVNQQHRFLDLEKNILYGRNNHLSY